MGAFDDQKPIVLRVSDLVNMRKKNARGMGYIVRIDEGLLDEGLLGEEPTYYVSDKFKVFSQSDEIITCSRDDLTFYCRTEKWKEKEVVVHLKYGVGSVFRTRTFGPTQEDDDVEIIVSVTKEMVTVKAGDLIPFGAGKTPAVKLLGTDFYDMGIDDDLLDDKGMKAVPVG